MVEGEPAFNNLFHGRWSRDLARSTGCIRIPSRMPNKGKLIPPVAGCKAAVLVGFEQGMDLRHCSAANLQRGAMACPAGKFAGFGGWPCRAGLGKSLG